MSCQGTVGTIIETKRNGEEELHVEWHISDLFSLSDKPSDWYESSIFRFRDASWRLSLYPNRNASDTLGFFLHRTDAGLPKYVSFTFGLKSVDGVEKKFEQEWMFLKNSDGRGWNNLCKRSELRNEMSRLMPENTLTMICQLKTGAAASGRIIENEMISLLEQNESLQRAVENYGLESDNFKKQISSLEGEKLSIADEYKCLLEEKVTIISGLEKERDRYKAALDDDAKDNSNGHNHNENHESNCKKNLKQLSQVKKTKKRPFLYLPAPLEGGALEGALQFLYSGEVEDMSVVTVCGIYAAAHRFLLQDLKYLCLEYMKDRMCPEMVCGALAVAETHGEGDLKESAMECFLRESRAVCMTEGWKDLRKDHPSVVAEIFEESIKRGRMN